MQMDMGFHQSKCSFNINLFLVHLKGVHISVRMKKWSTLSKLRGKIYKANRTEEKKRKKKLLTACNT